MNIDYRLSKIEKAFFGLFLFLFLSIPLKAFARDDSRITDWYIKDFQSRITVNTDSSLLITEKITADCGNLPGKHGIFRTLPTYYQKTGNKKINTPVELVSITDFSDNKIPYSKSVKDRAITWKIGDANKTVSGLNYYKIQYKVKNAIRFDNPNFDEFYWNLNGNFWQIETDNFEATINFPAGIDQNSAKEINLYSGLLSQNKNTLASHSWIDNNSLFVKSTETLKASEGITLSVTFPKGVITPYKPSFIEKYGGYLFLIIPLLTFFFCFKIWRKFGKDFKLNRPIMAEYDIPLNLMPMEFGTLYQNGQLKTPIISAAIINLAVRKYLKIEQLEKKGIFGKNDFSLIKLSNNKPLTGSEQDLIGYLFATGDQVKLSDLKNKFYDKIPVLKKSALTSLENDDLFDPAGFKYQIAMIIIGSILIAGSFALISVCPILMANVIVSGIIILIFAGLMPKRTEKGAETYWKIQGFKLFITVTEKYRQQFNEKENIFEKFLPYAMIFGLTKVWINNMKKIYGEEYFSTYHPYWFYGAAFTHFDTNSFNSMMNDLSSNMNSAISSNPSSSGSGGGGFSGGGGGGGGGGGW